MLSICIVQYLSPVLTLSSPVSSRWGRWKDILLHGRFKKQLTERDVESICRALLAYCLVHYRGDDKIKSFMWDLIAPSEDGQTKELQNHLGTLQPLNDQTSGVQPQIRIWFLSRNSSFKGHFPLPLYYWFTVNSCNMGL